MTQLDRIEAALEELLALARDDGRQARASQLAADMRDAVATVERMKAEAATEAAVDALVPPDDPGVSKAPRVPVAKAEGGETLPYEEHPKTAKHRPDQAGGAPPVRAEKDNPDTPKQFIGVPQWEKGREPRVVEFLKRRLKK